MPHTPSQAVAAAISAIRQVPTRWNNHRRMKEFLRPGSPGIAPDMLPPGPNDDILGHVTGGRPVNG